jgi:hypothetical protein
MGAAARGGDHDAFGIGDVDVVGVAAGPAISFNPGSFSITARGNGERRWVSTTASALMPRASRSVS